MTYVLMSNTRKALIFRYRRSKSTSMMSRARKKVFLTIVWKVVNFNMLILLS